MPYIYCHTYTTPHHTTGGEGDSTMADPWPWPPRGWNAGPYIYNISYVSYIYIHHVYIYIFTSYIYTYIIYIYMYMYTYMHRTNSISDTHFLWVGTFVRSFVLGSHTLKPCEISCIPGHTSTWGMFLSLSPYLSKHIYVYINILQRVYIQYTLHTMPIIVYTSVHLQCII